MVDPDATSASAEPASSSAEPAEALAALVAKLRAELTGVRTAMRNRAVIEQAKGVLVERLRISPDQGFDHLVRLSQRTNIKLIEIAAAIVGTTAPDPNAPDVVSLIDDELREHVAKARDRQRTPVHDQPRKAARAPEVEALQAQHQLLSARIGAARSYDEIAEAFSTASTGWPQPDSMILTLLDPDGAQRIAGAHGLSSDARSQWSRIPPDPALPMVIAVRDRETIWLADPAAVQERFPALDELPFGGSTVVAAPIIAGERVVGAVLMSWREELPNGGDEVRRYVTALVEPVARRVDAMIGDEIVDAWFDMPSDPAVTGLPIDPTDVRTGQTGRGRAPAQVWLPTVIDALHNPAALLAPISEDGQIVDFRIDYVNAYARRIVTAARVDPDESTLLAVYPGMGSNVLLPELARLLQDGQPRRLDGLRADPRYDGVAGRADHLPARRAAVGPGLRGLAGVDRRRPALRPVAAGRADRRDRLVHLGTARRRAALLARAAADAAERRPGEGERADRERARRRSAGRTRCGKANPR